MCQQEQLLLCYIMITSFVSLFRLSPFRYMQSLYPSFYHIAYCLFGAAVDEDKAKEDFKKICDEHFPVLLDTFLKDTKFCYSDTPTIADLGVAPLLTLIKGRPKFWAKVPEGIKEYHASVLEAHPGADEYFKMLDGLATSYDGPGADAEP